MRSLLLVRALVSVAAAAAAAAPDPTQCEGGPCGPGNERCAGVKVQTFVFHLFDTSCHTNDPNAPMFDPMHGLYHTFYQRYQGEPQHGTQRPLRADWPSWSHTMGHWVSRDFTHWAQLPVALWNDQWFDAGATFTGSATIVDGGPVILYPGLCRIDSASCPTGDNYAVAVPANASDPLLVQWTKQGSIGGRSVTNPVLNATGDDPSSAWRTVNGEWRLIGDQGGCGDGGANSSSTTGTPIFGSMNFREWYRIGCTTLSLGDCPTLFPLPPLVPGSADGISKDGLPTHVHKAGTLGFSPDCVQIGDWHDGLPGPAAQGGTPGSWEPLTGQIPLDAGRVHAAKDFWDPVKQRRIMWLWATLGTGLQTVPRELRYDPRLQRIVSNPVDEIKRLRTT